VSEEENYYLNIALTQAREWFGKPRELGHVSDITTCPRQKTFESLDPEPEEISFKKLGYFTSGKAVHSALQSLYRANRGRFECEKYLEHCGIVGTVDIYDKHRNIPIEFKTYRAGVWDSAPILSKPMAYAQDQLMYYMAMLDSPVGHMIYQFLAQPRANGVDIVFKEFEIEMSQHERREKLGQLVQEVTTLKNAIKTKDPSIARAIYDNKNLNWLCKECKYVKECEGMRPTAKN
jgi:hypothetical protein